MKKILTLALILISVITFSQENKLSQFQKTLLQVKNQDSLQALKEEILNVYKTVSIRNSIKESTKWKFLCSTENGWTEIVGRNKTITDSKFVSKTKIIYSTQEVFELFDLKYNDSSIIDFVPFVFERDNYYNRKTTPIILNNSYLIVRYVHSYPNGNQTSWYHENSYYFKKEE